jgi:hypothetical protein
MPKQLYSTYAALCNEQAEAQQIVRPFKASIIMNEGLIDRISSSQKVCF